MYQQRIMFGLVFAILFSLSLSACSSTRSAGNEDAGGVTSEKGARQDSTSESPYSPYEDVITESAESSLGLFGAHMVDEELFFEIPDSLLERDILLITRIARIPADISGFMNAGSKIGEHVIRWERAGDRIFLRSRSFRNVAADSLAIALSVEANNFQPIMGSFDIESLSKDSAGVVIKVTNLFKNDIPSMSGLSSSLRTRFKVRRLDPERTFIDEVKSFPINVNVRHTLTYEATEPPSNSWTGTISMQMFQSMILLPEKPMLPRLEDPRVGYFTISQIDFGSPEQKAATRSYIRRWRLEPSDPQAYARGELVEPVKPIVYYLDPATPKKWRPFFIKGVQDWQWVFEAAGFKNAIIALEAPTKEEDPDWDPEDARFSTVRYVANLTRNATGPSVSDPRSGEIIESDIIWYHNHISFYRDRLMVETGASNPEARSLIIGDDLIGETMRQVIAHEIGHALGLPHNMIASSSFPVDSLRSPTFTSEFGVAPTIMDYARQNYIAQPGDGVTRFVRKVGPYDRYAIEWGYRHYADAQTPDDEKARLDAFIEAHAHDPMYRYASSTAFNPEAQTEDLGDDPVKASTYAVSNLKRVVPNLIEWTSRDGLGYEDLAQIYGMVQSQWNRYMNHVVTLVGGIYVNPKASNQSGVIYSTVPAERQREAMAFLRENVFETPVWMLDQEILRRIEPAGAVNRVRSQQVNILNSLLQPNRMQRMVEAETVDQSNAYPLLEFMGDLKDAVWHELDDRRPTIDTYRRNLQRGYLARLEYLMTQESTANFPSFYGTNVNVGQSDIRSFVRAQLRELQRRSEARAAVAGDEVTRFHLLDVEERIVQILEVD